MYKLDCWSEFTACNKRGAQDIIFLRVQGTCWCIDAVVSYNYYLVWWNLRQFNLKQLFIREPD